MFVIFVREVFCEVIGNVLSSLLTVEVKFFLPDATPHPVEYYFKCFGTFMAHVSGEDDIGGFAVSFDWSERLKMAHFNQGCVDGNSLLVVEKYCTGFSLGDGCHDVADALAIGEDWAVWSGSRSYGGRGWSVTHIVMACSKTVFFGLNDILCFTSYVDTHVAIVKTDSGVWFYGSVVHQHIRIFDGVGGGKSVLRSDFVERNEHGGIDGA